ncbi:DUF6262 family protein [Cyanothece sp. BG0011]|uniref:DUF6262 family protein n=1 Tax=Cyanothece sp. BG0011 TaxID=2082950 RepID=UPI000D1E233F|nr:DUF6262 family protein [Cyanothece sp. BG0011]
MSQQTKEERIKTLKATQETRKQETLDKVNKAIERLLKTGAKISFQAIAREANVSVPYLYKYPELKERIQQLRSQQRKMPSYQVNQPPVNAKTHSQMVGRLKKRIQQLEEENKELKRKNEALAGQVYRVHSLQEQVERQKDLIVTLESRLKEPPKAEVIPITSKAKLQINDSIKTQLDELGIPLNTTLTKTIKGASKDTVLAAIEAVKHQLEKREVDNPGGLLNKAIQEGWTKPEPTSVPSPPKPKIYHPTEDEEKKTLSSKDLAKLSNLFKDK